VQITPFRSMNRIFIHTSYVLCENDLPTEVDALGLGSRGKQREAGSPGSDLVLPHSSRSEVVEDDRFRREVPSRFAQ